jgi:hypothetical protein
MRRPRLADDLDAVRQLAGDPRQQRRRVEPRWRRRAGGEEQRAERLLQHRRDAHRIGADAPRRPAHVVAFVARSLLEHRGVVRDRAERRPQVVPESLLHPLEECVQADGVDLAVVQDGQVAAAL